MHELAGLVQEINKRQEYAFVRSASVAPFIETLSSPGTPPGRSGHRRGPQTPPAAAAARRTSSFVPIPSQNGRGAALRDHWEGQHVPSA